MTDETQQEQKPLVAEFTITLYKADNGGGWYRCAMTDETQAQDYTGWAWFVDGLLTQYGAKPTFYLESGTHSIKLQLARGDEVATRTLEKTVGSGIVEEEETPTMPDTPPTETTGGDAEIVIAPEKPITADDIKHIIEMIIVIGDHIESVAVAIKPILEAIANINDPNKRLLAIGAGVGFVIGAAAGIAGTMWYTGLI